MFSLRNNVRNRLTFPVKNLPRPHWASRPVHYRRFVLHVNNTDEILPSGFTAQTTTVTLLSRPIIKVHRRRRRVYDLNVAGAHTVSEFQISTPRLSPGRAHVSITIRYCSTFIGNHSCFCVSDIRVTMSR